MHCQYDQKINQQDVEGLNGRAGNEFKIGNMHVNVSTNIQIFKSHVEQ